MDVILFSQRLRRILAGEEGTMLDGAKEQIQNLQSEIEIMVSFLNEHPYMFQADDLRPAAEFRILTDSEDEYEDNNVDEPADDKEGQREDKENKREEEDDEKDADYKDDDHGKVEEDEGEADDKEDHLEDRDDDQGKDNEDEGNADDKEDHLEDKDDEQGKVEEGEGETNHKEDNVEDKDDDQGKVEEDERETADKEHHFEDKDDDQDKDDEDEDEEDANVYLDEKAVKRKMLGLIHQMVCFVRKCEKAIDTCIINTLLQLQQKTESGRNCKKLCLSLQNLQRKISPNIQRTIQQVLRVISIQNQIYNSSPSSGSVQSDTELINGKPCVEGSEDKMEKLLDLLIEGQPQLSFIGLVGNTELDKTTFAAQAYNSNYVKNYFDCHAWVMVGPEYNSNEVLDDLMKFVIPSSHLSQILEKDFQQKRIALRDYLRNKRYIIVLEDIFDDIWDDLKEALPDFHNGSRVLVTLGDMKIIRKFSFENGEKFSFRHRIPLTGPVKLTYDDWHFIILNVGSKSLEEIYEQYSISNMVHWFRFETYYSLPFYLKPCFLYFAVFHKGIEISTRHLYQLWIAEGFIPDNNVATAERYLEEIINRGLLHVRRRRYTGEVKTLYILSMPWLLSLCAAFGIEFMTNFGIIDKGVPCEGIKFYSIQKDLPEFVSSKHYGPYLRSLLCLISVGDHPKDYNYISKNFKLLKVLDLETLILEQCPHGIENLLLLRYLKLNIPSLTTMPSSLCNLLNLFTLDMPSSKIDHTPEDIWKMLKLKHLYFYFINLPAHPGRFCNSLKDLNFISTLHASSCTRDIFVRLPNLQSLRIFGNLSSYQSVMSNSLSELLYLESLKLVNETNISHNSSIILGEYQFPPRLTHLSLSNTELKDDPMPTLEKLPNLQVLKLKHNSYVGRKMGCSPGGFPSLKVLHLKSMLWLEEWTIGTGAMSKLECLIINPCAYLRKLPEELWYIKSFQKLELWWPQPELKKRLREVEDKEWYDIQIYPFGV